jgi:hypothetical protein
LTRSTEGNSAPGSLAEGGTTGFWATACHEIPANAEKRNDEIIRDDRFI